MFVNTCRQLVVTASDLTDGTAADLEAPSTGSLVWLFVCSENLNEWKLVGLYK